MLFVQSDSKPPTWKVWLSTLFIYGFVTPFAVRFLNLFAFSSSAYVFLMPELFGVSRYVFASDLLAIITTTLMSGLSATLVYVFAGRYLQRMYGVSTARSVVIGVLILLMATAWLTFACAIDVFTGCKLADLLDIGSIISFLAGTMGPFVFAEVIVRRSRSSLWVLVLKLFGVFVGLSLLGVVYVYFFGSTIHDRDGEAMPTALVESDRIVYSSLALPDSMGTVNVPSTYISESGAWHMSTRENRIYANTPYDYVYSQYWRHVSGGAVSIYLKHIETSESQTVFERLNFCGKEFPPDDSTRWIDESEVCESREDIVTTAQGVQYCETYNVRNQAIFDSKEELSDERQGSLLTKLVISKTSSVIEDRDRVFVAQLPWAQDYCAILTLHHEPQDAKTETLDAMAQHILSSLQQ